MPDWNPRDELGYFDYHFRFKLGGWCQVDSLPDWIHSNPPTYTKGRKLAIDGERAYHEREIWVGNNLKYLMKWIPQAQNDLELGGMYVKKK